MSKTDTEIRAEKLKEAVKQMNGQHDRTINLLADMVIKLTEEVAELRAVVIRKVHKVRS